MEKTIKIILAILLFLCLAKMSYGYYQLVRFLALLGFAILAFQSHKRENQNEVIIYIALALLFQPLFKISLGKKLWNTIDVIVGIGLLLSLFMMKRKLK